VSTIRILPDQVANRIAAGEVIERPVAVIKELVDNSIDAGADRIKVQFKQGGKSYMLVEDNGKGMTPDDALLSLERHATSKIRGSDDLFNIQTLGFRGEAIPSIASVSRFLMRTRPEADVEGTEILVNGGKLIHRKEVGTPPGTRIEVTHLFSSIPARRKFLKTDNTEASHIIQWMRLMAVAHPGVAFRLLSNDRTLFSLPNHESQLQRILALWGREFENKLESFEFEQDDIQASGFIGKAGVSRPSRSDIVTIVNGRPVESRTLGFAFTEAFHTHIPKGRYPLVFLQLKIDPSLIDVNIHPSKKEIKFKNESKVRTLIIQNVWRVLRGNNSIGIPGQTWQKPDAGATPANSVAPNPSKPSIGQSPARPTQKPVSSNSIPQPRQPGNTAFAHSGTTTASQTSANESTFESKPANAHATAQPEAPTHQRVSDLAREWRFIGSYRRAYSLFERSNGLTLVHSSRALRRIGYEKVLAGLQSQSTAVQEEIVPTTLELDAHTSGRLKMWIPTLKKCGFLVEEFGRNFFRIEAVPSLLNGEEAKNLIEKWLHQDGADSSLNLETTQTDIALLCSSKYRKQLELPLREEVAFDILKQLLDCDQPMVDPEGKAIVQQIPHRLLDGSSFKSLEEI